MAGQSCFADKQYAAAYLSSVEQQSVEVSSLSKDTQHNGIGLIDRRCVKGGEINPGGAFGIMPHRLADGRYRYVLAFGYARPGMASDIARQRDFQAELFTYLFQLVVHKMRAVFVLCATVHAVFLDDGQQIRAVPRIVLVDDFLHGLLPFDEQLLAGLLRR